MIKIDSNTKKILMDLYVKKGIGLEGNITKLIDTENDEDFKKYLKECETKDSEKRKKRLEMTKKIQKQNEDLKSLNTENQQILEELQTTLKEVEESKLTFEVQNRELNEWKQDNLRLTEELKNEMVKSEQARIDAERAKENAINDLDILQKRNQTELISTIVRVALWVIMGVGVVTTGVYVLTLFLGKDTQIISAAWSNIFGILLTNAFSIVGTIMGIKYATENNNNQQQQ
jgi:predicted RNase H-like nuclease (RuvC/YqgF family)